MWPDVQWLRTIISQAAEQELLPRFGTAACSRKADGSVVTEADLVMQRRVQDELAKHWPEYSLLGEETDEQRRHELLADGSSPIWCLDPLDGTSNFTASIPFFSVSLALLAGGESVLGLVYDPIRRECFTAEKGQGAWLDDIGVSPSGES